MGTVFRSQSHISFRLLNPEVYNIYSFSNIDIMIRTTQALLTAVMFLFGLEEAVQSQRGYCAGNQCFAVFQESKNFSGAMKSCGNSSGELFLIGLDRDLTTVLSGFRGSLWLRTSSNETIEGAMAGLQMCSFMSVMGGNYTLLSTPCRDELDGFLCQYTTQEPCSRFQAVGGEQVKYVAHEGFEVYDSETFPQGTIAVVEKVGKTYPDSKHLCFKSTWKPAPWRCEVMNGGCEHSCNHKTDTCACPAKQILHPNNITCSKEPCADCAHGCLYEGDNYKCTCIIGYRLAQDRKSCLDVDECAEEDLCRGEGEECENTQGSFECHCKDGFIEEDGVCEDVSICQECEHMRCEKSNGVYQCLCNTGFRVSPKHPTRCEKHCAERDCPATCIQNPDLKKKDMQQCFCPDGYIQDVRNNTAFCTDIDECELPKQCEHKCENTFGSYRCLCNEGFELITNHKCVQTYDETEDDGSGSSTSYPTPASAHPAAVPSYIKTGSVLGISVFTVMCMALLFFMAQNISKRCGRFHLPSLKSPDIDIFYLQQVTTDTYKRLSFDKQFKNDSQRF